MVGWVVDHWLEGALGHNNSGVGDGVFGIVVVVVGGENSSDNRRTKTSLGTTVEWWWWSGETR